MGDTHGRTNWKDHVEKAKADKVIFMGDYFDSYDKDLTTTLQIHNFKEIIEFKESYEGEVVLLIGNHDYHYMAQAFPEEYSGHQGYAGMNITKVLRENDAHLQMCTSHGRFLFTHAGLSKTWCEEYEIDEKNVVEQLNELFHQKPHSFRFKGWSPSGDSKESGPLWIRPHSLLADGIEGWTHVVGHTSAKYLDVETYPDTLLLVDTMAENQSLIIEEGLDGMDLSVQDMQGGEESSL